MTQRAVMVVADGFHDEEAADTAAYLRERGVEVVATGIRTGTVTGKHDRETLEIAAAVGALDPADYGLRLIPGGSAPESLRQDVGVLDFVRRYFEREGAVVGAICHGPQVLISAGVLPGRTLTCYAGIRDDVRLAGARYQDRKVVVDGRLVTSRTPKDIPAFNQALAKALGLEEPEPADEAGADEAPEPTEATS